MLCAGAAAQGRTRGLNFFVWNFAWDRLASRLYAATATTFLMKRCYITRPGRRHIWYLLRVQSLIYVLLYSLNYCLHHHVMWDFVITPYGCKLQEVSMTQLTCWNLWEQSIPLEQIPATQTKHGCFFNMFFMVPRIHIDNEKLDYFGSKYEMMWCFDLSTTDL